MLRTSLSAENLLSEKVLKMKVNAGWIEREIRVRIIISSAEKDQVNTIKETKCR